MERNTQLPITRFLILSLLMSMIHFFELTSLLAPNETRSRVVFAFPTRARSRRKKCINLGVRERRNAFLSRSIGNYIGDKYTDSRNLSLMSHRIGVIGGGLAGLSIAYHLLEKSPSSDITIIDPRSPGTGGASAVAGG